MGVNPKMVGFSPTNPWVFLLKVIILGCEMGVPPFKETPISHLWKRKIILKINFSKYMLVLGRVNWGEVLYTSMRTHKNLHF